MLLLASSSEILTSQTAKSFSCFTNELSVWKRYQFIFRENYEASILPFHRHENKFIHGLLVVISFINLLPSSGADSCDLGDWVSAQFSSRAAGHEIHHEPLYLIVFDATWKHAKEMVRGSLPFLSKFSHQVSLPVDARLEGSSIYDSDLILRKEPFSGCVSTMEAVARSLRLLEVDGDEIEQKLLSVLRAMVAFQACNLKPMKPRPRLVKKSKNSCLLSN
ncbi:uncharacterized protein LOC126410387 isoform X3 [Nymphaea colorata]|uniref:uncharacterized protein LOC126410387 isoform X3 n=1 Tax=Nymphaea colorata TaxID=210225 RepID=UPI00214F6011|nr:uncharacterized protein LOC126410387 isoform X3 [Nymphaea colorata]